VDEGVIGKKQRKLLFAAKFDWLEGGMRYSAWHHGRMRRDYTLQ